MKKVYEEAIKRSKQRKIASLKMISKGEKKFQKTLINGLKNEEKMKQAKITEVGVKNPDKIELV